MKKHYSHSTTNKHIQIIHTISIYLKHTEQSTCSNFPWVSMIPTDLPVFVITFVFLTLISTLRISINFVNYQSASWIFRAKKCWKAFFPHPSFSSLLVLFNPPFLAISYFRLLPDSLFDCFLVFWFRTSQYMFPVFSHLGFVKAYRQIFAQISQQITLWYKWSTFNRRVFLGNVTDRSQSPAHESGTVCLLRCERLKITNISKSC